MMLPGFGARIQEARERRGRTQAELAQDLGVKGGTVSRWESGGGPDSIETVWRLARALRVPCAWLLLGRAGLVDLHQYERRAGEYRGRERRDTAVSNQEPA